MKYTQEETDWMVNLYTSCKTQDERNRAINDISVQLHKSEHSVRAKLVAEGVYIANKRTSKITGGAPKSKETMVMEMEEKFGFQPGQLEGLEKAPKLVLVALYKKLKYYMSGIEQKKN